MGITKDQVFCKDPKNVKTSHTCFDVKTSGRYFQILMPSNNVLTLRGEFFGGNSVLMLSTKMSKSDLLKNILQGIGKRKHFFFLKKFWQLSVENQFLM